MDRRHPGERERSLYASVELSLQRLSPEQRERAAVLAVFQGSVDLDLLRVMMDWEQDQVADLARALIDTGLATPGPYNHLALNPALCPYLRRQRSQAPRADAPPATQPATQPGTQPAIAPGRPAAEPADLDARWQRAMGQYVDFLVQQHSRNSELAATLTRLDLANLLALLARVEADGVPEATIALATSLHQLFQFLGRPRLLARVAHARDAAERALGADWGHAAFQARRTRIEHQLAAGQLQAALDGAQALLARAQQGQAGAGAGEAAGDGAAADDAYPEADYDLAMAHFLLARVMKTAGGAEQALPLLDAAQRGFEAIARARSSRAAEGMVSVCLAERGDCLLFLGRLDAAASAYEEAIRRDEELGAERNVAADKCQLGTVRLRQGRLDDALAAYAEARARFGLRGLSRLPARRRREPLRHRPARAGHRRAAQRRPGGRRRGAAAGGDRRPEPLGAVPHLRCMPDGHHPRQPRPGPG
jgi:tetratricopeptide (TPR) repeat protein